MSDRSSARPEDAQLWLRPLAGGPSQQMLRAGDEPFTSFLYPPVCFTSNTLRPAFLLRYVHANEAADGDLTLTPVVMPPRPPSLWRSRPLRFTPARRPRALLGEQLTLSHAHAPSLPRLSPRPSVLFPGRPWALSPVLPTDSGTDYFHLLLRGNECAGHP